MAAHRGKLKLKPLSEQVIVITGATSGIGLSTARAAAARGAKLFLVARNEDALKDVSQDLRGKGAEVGWCVADVGDAEQIKKVAKHAIDRFGGFDTWVNNAGVSIFGDITRVPLEDQRRLFDTNYWGVVHGSLTAVEHLRNRVGGGAIINVGSVLGDLAIPTQGAYSASKHAVRGFTNALRMELMEQKAPITITQIKPSAIDTPYKDHARNYTGHAVRNPAPVYATPLVAQAILYAAEHPVREMTVGGGGLLQTLAWTAWPHAVERALSRFVPQMSVDKSGRPASNDDNLHHAGHDLRERSYYPDVRETSLFSAAQMRPLATAGIAAAALAGIGAAYHLGRRRKQKLLTDPA
ncbi:SDR family oxidoreductase [Caulobacter sp. NIBR2454]|uniref:SDR family oxidoreductase n=1 Tax=Caulobacter sp. NIBR2454 TaxID=3015996 RepID=UPI0022B61098|nr:SDR family oxidoreductase [Caulobacter sp. NIBR2454]